MRSLLTTALALAVAASVCQAQVRLPHFLSDHMVLQREVPVKIWGWAAPGEKVTVAFAGQTKTVAAGADGAWIVTLDPMTASSDGRTLVVSSAISNFKSEIRDVLVGEVWIGSGQSNMAWPLKFSDDGRDIPAAGGNKQIRLLRLRSIAAFTPQDDINNVWQECSETSLPNFSAVAYHFADSLQKELKVPVGFIQTSWGGTFIMPWTPPEGFKNVPALADVYKKVSAPAPASQPTTKPSQNDPCVVYNAMVHPLRHFAVRGAIWYQGEADVMNDDGMLYYEKMKALIAGWRGAWGQPDMPFYWVQLSPFYYSVVFKAMPGMTEYSLPKIWEAQTEAMKIPHTGMAVITDVGAVKNIHPPLKKPVGQRLALWALAKTYGRKVVYSGPTFKSMRIEGGRAAITFDHVGDGLQIRSAGVSPVQPKEHGRDAHATHGQDARATGDTHATKDLTCFEIAGADMKFVPAQAKIDGKDRVVVWSDKVPQPADVRFAWHEMAQPNLVNSAGLPACTFRTSR
ncbi:MAG: sialate O-acetylesterase [Planctomycetaceae bacterium]|nr:hypothetical protein [Planctomycetaceae bacterium]